MGGMEVMPGSYMVDSDDDGEEGRVNEMEDSDEEGASDGSPVKRMRTYDDMLLATSGVRRGGGDADDYNEEDEEDGDMEARARAVALMAVHRNLFSASSKNMASGGSRRKRLQPIKCTTTSSSVAADDGGRRGDGDDEEMQDVEEAELKVKVTAGSGGGKRQFMAHLALSPTHSSGSVSAPTAPLSLITDGAGVGLTSSNNNGGGDADNMALNLSSKPVVASAVKTEMQSDDRDTAVDSPTKSRKLKMAGSDGSLAEELTADRDGAKIAGNCDAAVKEDLDATLCEETAVAASDKLEKDAEGQQQQDEEQGVMPNKDDVEMQHADADGEEDAEDEEEAAVDSALCRICNRRFVDNASLEEHTAAEHENAATSDTSTSTSPDNKSRPRSSRRGGGGDAGKSSGSTTAASTPSSTRKAGVSTRNGGSVPKLPQRHLSSSVKTNGIVY
jgi:hypothetical protein